MSGKPEYTINQRKAIDMRNHNMLISAAAGSGKTAVLVQRIINRILDECNPVDIDRILVMTFTRAAAAQMKERILDAINEKRLEDPHNSNLSRQYALVHNAYIMTIDSFCLNVVRNHFEEINLEPDFRMADEGEMRLLMQDVIEIVLEEFYEEGDEDFLRMTEVFASKKTDTSIEKLVLSLYSYAESYPDPENWLDYCTREYDKYCEDETSSEIIASSGWLQSYVNQIKADISYHRRAIDNAIDMCNMLYGPAAYSEALEEDLKFIDDLLEADSYEKLCLKCVSNAEYSFKKFSRLLLPKEGQVSDEELSQRQILKTRVSSVRDKYKKEISQIIEDVGSSSPDSIVAGMKLMTSPVNQLVKLTKAFMVKLSEKKREKNIVDFNDLEHMCLQILENGKDTTAAQYREFFAEIYVDEYQDSNFVQEEIVKLISKDDDSCGNVFMVGDVKQSIYGFRNAKPEIFVDKYNKYNVCLDDAMDELPRDVRIDLSDNFRSREQVLFSVNSVFERIMRKELGGIEYDEAAALHPGRKYMDSKCDNETELMLMVHDDDVIDREAEALMVACRIKELMKTMLVEDHGEMRTIKYSDIVILLRTSKGWDNVFMEILKDQGIPVFVTSSTGYFEAMEIRTLLNYLKIIDNPLQDIPLTAVMMSVIGNFYEEELAVIRGTFKDGYLYNAVISYEKTYSDTPIAAKVREFINTLERYRKKSEYLPVEDILTEIIDGDYGKIIKAMPNGTKRFANLNMLLKKAFEFGKTSYKGIFQFNRYIEAIQKYDIDYGEASITDENDNTVRIMSIHKSKGLEFPVCFICGMSKKFNIMDTNNTVLADSEYGIATDIVDVDKRVRSKSLFKAAISRKKRNEIIAEELRLLYVAMTRAKEKLIMTGTAKDEGAISESTVPLEKITSYLDMIACAASDGVVNNIKTVFYNVEDLVDEMVEESVTSDVRRNRLLSIIYGKEEPAKSELNAIDIEELMERVNYVYPYEDKGYVKLSVSELKKRSQIQKEDSDDEAEVTKHIYEDTKDGSKSGALHGTAVHRVFEIWDYSRDATEESVREFLDYIHDEKLIEDDLFDMVRFDEVYTFVNSDIAKRMKLASGNGTLHREQPFVICDNPDDSDSMLVQGIIDAYFIEDGKIVLVDYKTDRGKSEKQLINDHRTQLEYYGKALSRLLQLEMKESVIYSTYLGKTISI